MNGPILTRIEPGATFVTMRWRPMLVFAALPALLAGCVQVSAPDKPIEINLNINIRQEVVVRLQEDARDLIQSNPGVF